MLGATSSSFVVEVPLFSTVEVLDLSSPVLPPSISVLGVPFLPPSISEILTEILVSRERVRDRRQSIVTIKPAAAGRQGQNLLDRTLFICETRNVNFPSDFPKMTFYISKSYIRNPSYNNTTLNYQQFHELWLISYDS